MSGISNINPISEFASSLSSASNDVLKMDIDDKANDKTKKRHLEKNERTNLEENNKTEDEILPKPAKKIKTEDIVQNFKDIAIKAIKNWKVAREKKISESTSHIKNILSVSDSKTRALVQTILRKFEEDKKEFSQKDIDMPDASSSSAVKSVEPAKSTSNESLLQSYNQLQMANLLSFISLPNFPEVSLWLLTEAIENQQEDVIDSLLPNIDLSKHTPDIYMCLEKASLSTPKIWSKVQNKISSLSFTDKTFENKIHYCLWEMALNYQDRSFCEGLLKSGVNFLATNPFEEIKTCNHIIANLYNAKKEIIELFSFSLDLHLKNFIQKTIDEELFDNARLFIKMIPTNVLENEKSGAGLLFRNNILELIRKILESKNEKKIDFLFSLDILKYFPDIFDKSTNAILDLTPRLIREGKIDPTRALHRFTKYIPSDLTPASYKIMLILKENGAKFRDKDIYESSFLADWINKSLAKSIESIPNDRWEIPVYLGENNEILDNTNGIHNPSEASKKIIKWFIEKLEFKDDQYDHINSILLCPKLNTDIEIFNLLFKNKTPNEKQGIINYAFNFALADDRVDHNVSAFIHANWPISQPTAQLAFYNLIEQKRDNKNIENYNNIIKKFKILAELNVNIFKAQNDKSHTLRDFYMEADGYVIEKIFQYFANKSVVDENGFGLWTYYILINIRNQRKIGDSNSISCVQYLESYSTDLNSAFLLHLIFGRPLENFLDIEILHKIISFPISYDSLFKVASNLKTMIPKFLDISRFAISQEKLNEKIESGLINFLSIFNTFNTPKLDKPLIERLPEADQKAIHSLDYPKELENLIKSLNTNNVNFSKKEIDFYTSFKERLTQRNNFIAAHGIPERAREQTRALLEKIESFMKKERPKDFYALEESMPKADFIKKFEPFIKEIEKMAEPLIKEDKALFEEFLAAQRNKEAIYVNLEDNLKTILYCLKKQALDQGDDVIMGNTHNHDLKNGNSFLKSLAQAEGFCATAWSEKLHYFSNLFLGNKLKIGANSLRHPAEEQTNNVLKNFINRYIEDWCRGIYEMEIARDPNGFVGFEIHFKNALIQNEGEKLGIGKGKGFEDSHITNSRWKTDYQGIFHTDFRKEYESLKIFNLLEDAIYKTKEIKFLNLLDWMQENLLGEWENSGYESKEQAILQIATNKMKELNPIYESILKEVAFDKQRKALEEQIFVPLWEALRKAALIDFRAFETNIKEAVLNKNIKDIPEIIKAAVLADKKTAFANEVYDLDKGKFNIKYFWKFLNAQKLLKSAYSYYTFDKVTESLKQVI